MDNIVLQDGSNYTGQMRAPEGQGDYGDEGGPADRYTDWVLHGYGKKEWSNGARYEGNWKNNMSHGKGKLYHPNGDVFDGHFKKDMANGHGVFSRLDGFKQ